jgi:ketosteroid isomerase-like protein
MKKHITCFLLSLFFLNFQTTFAQPKEQSSALMSLVEAERSFARTSVQKGIRDSFLEFFADDGVNFTPAPGNAKEFYSKRPAGHSPIILDWSPIYADIAASGELGYTTGPFTVTSKADNKVVSQGYYLSVWKKQSDGNWKVAADIGIGTPAFESNEKPAYQLPKSISRKFFKSNPETESNKLTETEKAFSKISASNDFQKLYLNLIGKNARLHRNDSFPFVGKNAIKSFVSTGKFVLHYVPIKASVAQSGDLAYVYGSYEMKVSESSTMKDEKGSYLHIWKRMSNGVWQIVAEVMNQ